MNSNPQRRFKKSISDTNTTPVFQGNYLKQKRPAKAALNVFTTE